MAIGQALVEVLDETVKALSKLDLSELQALEQRIFVLAKDGVQYGSVDIGLALSTRHQLEIILQNFQINLDALTRLHARNMRNQWAQ
jgi:hypothetical protein